MARTEDIEAKLCAYIEGELDESGRAEIEKHLAANPQHRKLIEELREQRGLLGQLPRESAPGEIAESLSAQLERSALLADIDGDVQTASLRISRWPQIRAVAAVLLLAAGLAAAMYYLLPSPNRKPPDLARLDQVPGPAIPPGPTTAELDHDLRARAEAPPRPTASPVEPAPIEPPAERLSKGGEPAGDEMAAVDVPSRSSEDKLGKALPAEESAQARRAKMALGGAVSPGQPDSGLSGSPRNAQVFAPEAPGTMANTLNAGEQMFRQTVANEMKLGPVATEDGPMVRVMVASADPAAASREVTSFLDNNRITWQAVSEPMPSPLQIGQQQQVLGAAMPRDRMEKIGEAAAGVKSAATQPLASSPQPQAEERQEPGPYRQALPYAASQAVDASLAQQKKDFRVAGAAPGALDAAHASGPQVILARQMTRRQARELNSLLSEGSVRGIRAAKSSGGFNLAQPMGAVQQHPATSPAGEFGVQDLAHLQVPATNSVAAAPATEPTATQPALAATQLLTPLTPTTLPLMPGMPGALAAVEQSQAAPAATQPAATQPDGEERVDVLIVVRPEGSLQAPAAPETPELNEPAATQP